jgi:hypothetical protein
MVSAAFFTARGKRCSESSEERSKEPASNSRVMVRGESNLRNELIRSR